MKSLRQFRFGLVLAGLAGVWILTGCATWKKPQLHVKPKHTPSNVFKFASKMPSPIRRVAVLPITTEAGDWQGEASGMDLLPIVRSELGKANMFELTTIAPEQLRGWTGKGSWRSDEELPADFFEQLRLIVDCDAVMFTHLGAYRPYRPIALGWNIKLVEVTGKQILWSIDEVFDSSEGSVANSAEIYDRKHSQADYVSVAQSGIMISPQRFAHYTLDAVFGTLPER